MYEPWRKEDCQYYYEYYTFISSKGLVSMPNCSKGCFNCIECDEYKPKPLYIIK